jgi:hypothetical protein
MMLAMLLLVYIFTPGELEKYACMTAVDILLRCDFFSISHICDD